MKKYYGMNYEENRVMLATITGEMADGTKVYTECNEKGELLNNDNQYLRTIRYGAQFFFKL